MKKAIKILLSFFMIMVIVGCTTDQDNEVPDNSEETTKEQNETVQTTDQAFHLTEHLVRYYYQMPYTTDFILALTDDEMQRLIIDNGINVTINAWDLSFINEENTLLAKGYYDLTSRYNTNYEGDSTRDQMTASWQVPLTIKADQKYELQVSGICENTYFNDVSSEIYDDSYASIAYSYFIYATTDKTTDAIDTDYKEFGEKLTFGGLGDMDFYNNEYVVYSDTNQNDTQNIATVSIQLPEDINDYQTIYLIFCLTPSGLSVALNTIYYYYVYQLS